MFTILNSKVNSNVQAFQATAEDTPLIMELLISTAAWLKSKGSTQWAGLLRGEDHHDMIGYVSRGEVVVFKQDELLAGVVILMQQPSEWDLRLWGKKAQTMESAVYLHRLAINRDYAGKGLGEAMMRFVDSRIQFENKDRIRLDCIGNNPTLNKFYSGIGYELTGEVEGFCIYEKLLLQPGGLEKEG